MTTKLFIENKLADFFKDEAIVLTQSLKNVQELSGKFGAFTRQFSIPASPTNDGILSHYSNLDVDGLNPHVPIEAYILIDNIKQIDGFIEVKGVQYKDLKPYAYKITFYANQTNIKFDLGNLKIADVDWSSLDTTLTYANVKASWAAANPDVLFPLIGSSRDWIYMDTTAHADNIKLSTSGILLEELKPAYKLKSIIELMLSGVISVSWGTDISIFLDKAYVQPSASAGALKIPVDYNLLVYEDSFTATSVIPVNFTNIRLDPSGSYSSGVYTIPYGGTYIFRYLWTMLSALPSTYETAIRVNGSPVVSYSGTDKVEELTYEAVFSAGDEIEIRHTSAVNQTVSRGTFSLSFYPTNYFENTIVVGWADMLVVDFVKKFLDSFNLIITKEGLITDAESYLGATIDISDYVSRDFTANKVDMPALINLKHTESKAFNYTEFENYAQRKFGDATVTNDVVNPSSSIEVQSPFTVFPPAYIDSLNSSGDKIGVTDLLVHKQIDDKGKPIKNDFLLFYWNGEQSIDYDYYLQNDYVSGSPTFIQQTTFPLVTAAYGTKGLTYSNETMIDGTTATDNISDFFNDYLTMLYNKNTRKLDINAVLPVGIFLQIELSSKINIWGYYFRIEEIQYNFLNGETNLKLIRDE